MDITYLVMVVQMVLAELSASVTEEIIRVHKKVDMKCELGTNKVIRAAKKVGLHLEHCRGFYGSATHHWAKIGDFIIDPTGAQMVNGTNGVFTPDMPQYRNYNHVPDEVLDMDYMRRCPSSELYWRWLEIKEGISRGLLEQWYGEDAIEVRTSKRGDKYVYLSNVIHWGFGERLLKVRSITVFKNETNYNVLVWWASRTDNGNIRTWHNRYIVKSTYNEEFGMDVFTFLRSNRQDKLVNVGYGDDGNLNMLLKRALEELAFDKKNPPF